MADLFDIVVFPDDPLPQRGSQIAATIPQSQVARASIAIAVALAAWQPAPAQAQMPSKLPPALLAVQVDNPVPRKLPACSDVILASWQTVPPLPTLTNKLPQGAAVASLTKMSMAWTAALSWPGATALPQLSGKLPPSLLDVPVINPPFDSRGAAARNAIYAAWIVPAGLPNLGEEFSALLLSQSAGAPPVSAASSNIAQSWQSVPAIPQLTEKLPPSLLDVPVNAPAPNARSLALSTVYAAWQPLWYQPQTSRPFAWPTPVVGSVDSPPGGTTLLEVVVFDDFVLPQVNRKLPQAFVGTSTDNPPFDLRFRATARLTLDAWLPPAPPPQMPEYVVQSFTAPTGRGVPIIAVVADPPLPQRSPFVPTVATDVRVDSPVPQRSGAQRTVYDWWIPGPPAPQQSGHLLQGAPADAPPIRRGGEQRLVFDWWIPGPPLPQQSGHLLQGAPADAPPIRRGGEQRLVFDWWIPGPPAPQQSGKLVQPFAATSVDPPPVRRGGEQRVVFEYWRAPDPMPQMQGSVNASFEAISADNPPPNGGRSSSLSAIISAWTPVSTSQPARVLAPPPSAQIDNPPPQQNNWRRVVIESWQPVAPAPQRAKVQVIQGVSVDTVPFYRPWLRSVVEQWNIQPPHRQRWVQIVPVHTAPPVPVPGIRIVYVLEQDRIVIVPAENRTVVAVDPVRAVTSA